MRQLGLITLLAATGCAAILILAGATAAGQDPAVTFQRAIQLETVDGDLNAAIEHYKQVIKSNGGNRSLAAKALLRLGGCYEKVGKDEARKAYQQLVSEYADQQQQVKLARQRLSALAKVTEAVAAAPKFRRLVTPSKPRHRSGGMLSPDGKQLAFLAGGAVWTVPISGGVLPDVVGEPVQLTPNMKAWDNGNATLGWSADGKWISFRTDPTNSLYVAMSSGGKPMLVLEDGGGGLSNLGFRASLSPDGTTAAFAKKDEDGKLRLFKVPVKGGQPTRLTAEPAYEPVFSPNGKHLVYISLSYESATRARPTQVKIVPAAGGSPVLVSDPNGEPASPFWSPDGRMLAFRVYFRGEKGRPARNELWIMHLSDKAQLSADATRISLGEVSSTVQYGNPEQKYTVLGGWSSRNEIVVFTETLLQENIYTVSSSGGRAKPISSAATPPSWSADGRRVYVRSSRGIEYVPVGGGAPVLIPIRPKDASVLMVPPVVSPDGKWIAFAGLRDRQTPPALFKVPVQGGVPTQVWDPKQKLAWYPPSLCWSPDGNWIAFTGFAGGHHLAAEKNVYRIPAAGGEQKQLTSGSDHVAFSVLSWSPDGKSIAFFGDDNTIRTVPPEGGQSRVLLRDASIAPAYIDARGLSWSPDGKELAFSVLGYESTIKIVPANGGKPRQISTGFTGWVNWLSWSPDGRKFAFVGASGQEEEIWLMSDFLSLVKRDR